MSPVPGLRLWIQQNLLSLGETLHELRLQKGLSLAETDAFIDERTLEDSHPLLPRALALVTRELREKKKMSRMDLSEACSLPLGLINKVERAKAHDITVARVVRLALALEHPPGDFVEQVFEAEERLRSSAT